MAKIFSVTVRSGLARVMDPLARALLRVGISPDAVTVAGSVGAVCGAVLLGARGYLIAGTVVVTVFAMTDLVDGAMARLRGPSRFGALLDSTMDRIVDAAIFGSVGFWLATQHRYPALAATLICLSAGQVVSYVKARADGLGLPADVGLAERAERLITVGLGSLLAGAGVPYALDVALWLLAAASVVTIGQRLLQARRGQPPVATPAPAGSVGPDRPS